MIYNKLVRDGIPALIKDGKPYTRVLAEQEDIERFSLAKFYEEFEEFLDKPCYEEAADVIEALYKYFSTKLEDVSLVEEYRVKKAAEKGTFHENIVLLSVTK